MLEKLNKGAILKKLKILICCSDEERASAALKELNEHEVEVARTAHEALYRITSLDEDGKTVRGEWDIVITDFSIKPLSNSDNLDSLGPLIALQAVVEDRPIIAVLNNSLGGKSDSEGIFMKLCIWNPVHNLKNSITWLAGNIANLPDWNKIVNVLLKTKEEQ